MMYNTVDEWLDEIENYSTRRERMLMADPKTIELWVMEAWRLGQMSGMSQVLDQIKPKIDAIDESNKKLNEILNKEIP